MLDGAEKDPITGLKHHTHYGRPNWNALFDEYSRLHPKQEIGVFVCGPQEINHSFS